MKHEIAEAVSTTAQESAGSVSKVAPAAVGGGVSAMTIFGYPLPDIVQLLTFVYVLFSIVKLFWDWVEEAKAKKKAND